MSDKDIFEQLNFDEEDKKIIVMRGSRRRRSRHHSSSSHTSDHHSSSSHTSGHHSSSSHSKKHRSSSSHSSKHHSSSSSSSKLFGEKNRRKKKLSKKQKINLIASCMMLCLLVVFMVLIKYADVHGKDKVDLDNIETTNESAFVVEHIPFDSDVDIITGVAKYCYELEVGQSLSVVVNNYREQGYTNFDKSVPVILEHTISNLQDDIEIKGYTVELSEYNDFSVSKKYSFTEDQRISLDYLKTNTRYFYKVKFQGIDYHYSGEFKTSDTPRLLSVSGISNVRDIGNWKTTDGRRIKQGLLYRGTELDGLVEPTYKLTS
ncbi:MAG: tyrosine-protein phosphatase, partial [Clostridia bacterium]|nr:tyrosine-protein phosphatase [Clostridia bacterium]